MNRNEEKTLIAITIACVLIIAIAIVDQTITKNKNMYEANGIIYAVDFQEDMTLLETEDGNLFGMLGTETWPKGTEVIITLDSTGTKTPIDDKVIAVRRP